MSKINKINIAEPPYTKEEKLLIGFLREEVKRINYGSVTMDIRIHNSTITNIQTTNIKRTFNLHNA